MKKSVSFFVFLAGAIIFFALISVPIILTRSCKQNNFDSKTMRDVYIGETVTNYKNVEFTVLDVKNTKKIGTSSTEGNFIVILIKVYN